MPVLFSRSECRSGFWHVVTYDIADPDRWTELDDIATTQECGRASDPASPEARAQIVREMLRDPGAFSRWMDHPARFAVVMGWCKRGEDIMARASRRMQEGEAAAPETPPVTEPIIDGDDDFLADARAALGRWQRGGAGGAGAQRGSKEAEDTIRQILGDGADVVGAGLTGGPIGAGAALGAKLVATIPWEDVFKAIDEAIKAKKSHEVAMATLKSWERIGAAKDLLMALLDDPRFTDEQRTRYRAELKPKLSQAQNLASQVRRALENDNLDDAKRYAEALKGVLQQIRTWINNFQP